MIELIDDMFFWNAEGSFVKDFNKECINAMDFLNSILQFNTNCKIEKQKGYSRELGEIETLNYRPINKRKLLLNKQNRSNNDNSYFPYQLFLKLLIIHIKKN